jgi:hypothetical protein
MRGIVERNWPHLVARLPPEDIGDQGATNISDRTSPKEPLGLPNPVIVFAWPQTIEGTAMRNDWISPTPLEIAMSIAATVLMSAGFVMVAMG